MKPIKKTAILALAAAALAFQSAHAAIVINNGDLILGVETGDGAQGTATGNDFEVDLGNASQFTTTQAPEFFANVDLPDLTSQSFTQYSVVGQVESYTQTSGAGVTTSDGTIKPNSVFVTQDSAPSATYSASNNSGALSAINSLEYGSGGLSTATPTSTSLGTGALIPSGGGTSYSTEEFSGKGVFFNDATGLNGVASLTAGPTSSLKLYLLESALPVGASGLASVNPLKTELATDGSVVDLGTFTFINNPVGGGLELEFTGADYSPALTPEPSTYALMLLGMGLLAWQAKRRATSAKL